MTDVQNTPLRNPPIVEAILDVDCDHPPGFDLTKLDASVVAVFQDRYPKPRQQLLQEHLVETADNASTKMTMRLAVQALQFSQDDEKQLVQVRAQGFSFNRLAPYSSLDDYLPEIERTWQLYVGIASPIQIRAIRLRYINSILLPVTASTLDLDEYLKTGPRVPDGCNLMLSGFLHQLVATDKDTGHQVNTVLTSQASVNGMLPVILDITVTSTSGPEMPEWATISRTVASLRGLKNRVFENTLTPRCLELFQS